jgi:hypothetical protein
VKDLLKRQPLGAASLVVAVVALSVALVGTSFAGGGKVTSNKLANKAVTTKKLAAKAVTEGKLADSAVTSIKLANGAVVSGKLANIQAVQKNLHIAANSNAADTVDCPAGTTVISGGGAYIVTSANTDIQIRSSFRSGNGWRVAVKNNDGGAGGQDYTIEAYCLG